MSAPVPSMYSDAATAIATRLGLKMGKANLETMAATVLEMARADRNVLVVTSDSRGSGKLGPYGQALPDQIVEVGIAEQNLVGIAAGLASAGKTVFAVSPACFLTARALEQIKNDVAYTGNLVRLIGISAGVSYGALGSTHHSLHDLAALRAINNLEVIAPADNLETQQVVRSIVTRSTPTYLRFGKAPLYDLHPADAKIEIGKASLLRDGRDVAFIATGEAVAHAPLAAGQLADEGISARVISLHTIKPLDRDAILAAADCRAVVTVEEHSVHGGIGEACAGVLMEAGKHVRFRAVGIPDEHTVTGSQADIFRHYGITMEGLAATARGLLEAREVAMHILAIDQSTSATKALLYDRQLRVVGRASVSHPSIHPHADWVEQDAELIYQNTLSVIRQAASRELACIAITNQRETFVLFDRETGQPVHNAVVWQCRRGDAVCAELKAAGHENVIADRTGLRLDSYFSASKIAALLRQRPDLAERAANGSVLVGTIDTYLIYRLTGGKSFATDVTNASRTLLFNLMTLQWDKELCQLFGVPMRALADVRDSTAGFGHTDVVGRPVPIVGVLGDSQAALLGHGCVAAGRCKVTLGTGSSILLNTGERLAAAGESAVRAIGWADEGRPTYCLEGIINYSAATIAWLRDSLGLIESADESEPAARQVPDNGGVYLVPAFGGLSAPHWSPGAAAIVGMTASATRCHIIRAALESIAYQIRDALVTMQQDSGVTVSRLHVDGGATQNRFLMQFLADVTGVDLLISRNADCSSLGAAMAGAKGVGLYSSLADAAATVRDAELVQPAMPRDTAEALCAGWKRAVGQVLAGVA